MQIDTSVTPCYVKSEIFGIVDLFGCEPRKDFCIDHFQVINMGRNDPCFCGSGKKQKQCHCDVHEQSVIANLLRVYHELEKELAQAKNGVCAAGCDACCSDYFNIGAVEFFSILGYLKIGAKDGLPLKYNREAKKRIQGIVFPSDDTRNIPGYPPCIFVDDITHTCKIYAVRPIICRMYGAIDRFTDCEKVLSDENARRGLLPTPIKTDVSTNIDVFYDTHSKKKFELKPYPILYWFANLDDNGELKAQRMRDMLEAAFKLPVKEFVRICLLP